MRNFLAAIQFLTVVPVGRARAFDASGMVPFFPIVGLAAGMLLFSLDRGFLQLWTRPTASLLDVCLLIAITGAFHLDGLADTADGLYGHRSPQTALAIMKDSRIGAMGLVAVVCCLSIKWAGIAGLSENRGLALILVPAYSRGAILIGMKCLPYGRPEGGTGTSFFSKPLQLQAFMGLIPPVLLSIFLGWRGVVLIATFLVIVASVLAYYKRKVNCITGDMLGAMTEITEAGMFLSLSAGGLP